MRLSSYAPLLQTAFSLQMFIFMDVLLMYTVKSLNRQYTRDLEVSNQFLWQYSCSFYSKDRAHLEKVWRQQLMEPWEKLIWHLSLQNRWEMQESYKRLELLWECLRMYQESCLIFHSIYLEWCLWMGSSSLWIQGLRVRDQASIPNYWVWT